MSAISLPVGVNIGIRRAKAVSPIEATMAEIPICPPTIMATIYAALNFSWNRKAPAVPVPNYQRLSHQPDLSAS